MTQSFNDYQNRSIRLTDERLAHILDHPEMLELEAQIATVLQEPQVVRQSNSDSQVQLYYRYYAQTMVGAKWLCVIVKHLPNDAFIITTYLTDKLKQKVDLWQTMAKSVIVWFDPEADFLEVKFSDAPGYMRETDHDTILERVDIDGNVIGFSILNVSRLAKSHPLMAQLTGA